MLGDVTALVATHFNPNILPVCPCLPVFPLLVPVQPRPRAPTSKDPSSHELTDAVGQVGRWAYAKGRRWPSSSVKSMRDDLGRRSSRAPTRMRSRGIPPWQRDPSSPASEILACYPGVPTPLKGRRGNESGAYNALSLPWREESTVFPVTIHTYPFTSKSLANAPPPSWGHPKQWHHAPSSST